MTHSTRHVCHRRHKLEAEPEPVRVKPGLCVGVRWWIAIAFSLTLFGVLLVKACST